ncbi:MAG: hypothetical protein KF750_00520 [Xanthobacteraceae bacterium]|nr:hypothetical protein [Xanthobacteraceae bacterium]
MPYIDFTELKSRTDIAQVAQLLPLVLKPHGNQQRGPCPACNKGGDRTLVITPERGLFYCFSAKIGGDFIKLVAHIKGCTQNEAAQLIENAIGDKRASDRKADVQTGNAAAPPNGTAAKLKPLPYLEAEHPMVEALGISVATAEAFGGGYAGKGVLRGRFALPVYSREGTLLAYAGLAVSKQQSPQLLFHNFDPGVAIFNAHRLTDGGELIVCRDPLQLLLAVENGIAMETIIAFLTDSISVRQFEQLASLMKETQKVSAQLF